MEYWIGREETQGSLIRNVRSFDVDLIDKAMCKKIDIVA